MKIDLGCNGNKGKGYVGVDITPSKCVDVVHDLNKYPYPFEDNCADEILASHILEHLDDWTKAIKESHRILKPSGTLIIKVPHFSCVSAYSNIQHKHYFGCDTFNQLKYFKVKKIELRYMDTRKVEKRKWKYIPSRIISFFANLNIWFCERIWCYLVGGFGEIYVELEHQK